MPTCQGQPEDTRHIGLDGDGHGSVCVPTLSRPAQGTRLSSHAAGVVDLMDVCFVAVLRLLKEGADPNTPISSGGSLLHLVRRTVLNV